MDEQAQLTQLIDQRHQMDAALETLQAAVAELDHQIMTLLLQDGLKSAVGSNGTGYSLHSTTRYEFRAEAYRAIEDKGLLDYFRGKPKITKSALESLQKEGVIDPADFADIWAHAVVDQSPYALKRYVPKEARIL